MVPLLPVGCALTANHQDIPAIYILTNNLPVGCVPTANHQDIPAIFILTNNLPVGCVLTANHRTFPPYPYGLLTSLPIRLSYPLNNPKPNTFSISMVVGCEDTANGEEAKRPDKSGLLVI
ncbi:hypothetical protein [Mucilaginibacter sp. OK098]|uniref:hypothetical protein n=1 Tax=Mucilaginibacter sp. OK098 TaxID=1855297 RepID=UPI0011614EAC|nr:hypothetical protein [Mucilaginibacter sp. OK098]